VTVSFSRRTVFQEAPNFLTRGWSELLLCFCHTCGLFHVEFRAKYSCSS